MITPPSLSIGIEEEYLIVDTRTRDLVRQPDPDFLSQCAARIGGQVSPEFLQCQIEVGTHPHDTIAGVRADLVKLRQGVAEIAGRFGYAPIAASTHPFAGWREQRHTRKPRYDALNEDLGLMVRRLLICGCHVHVGIEDEDLRIDLMNQVAYFLPHLLALSCSSPFWSGEDTGLSSYRLTVFDALPRTGLPDFLSSYGEYRRLVAQLVNAGCIEDATKIWWDIRPSDKFPTLEQRVTDVCSRIDDTITIAAIYQGLLRYLYRLREANQRWRIYPATLINENRWRAQRYGCKGKLVDHGKGMLSPVPALVDEIIALLSPDAIEPAAHEAILGARRILAHGTSAQRQRATLQAALDGGADRDEAFIAVVDQLIEDFTHGCTMAQAESTDPRVERTEPQTESTDHI